MSSWQDNCQVSKNRCEVCGLRQVSRDCCDADSVVSVPKVPCCYIYDQPASVNFTASWSAACSLCAAPPPMPTSGTLVKTAGSECAPLYTSVNVPFYFAFAYQLTAPPATGACLGVGNGGALVAPSSSTCNLPSAGGESMGFTATFTLLFVNCIYNGNPCVATITITSNPI